MAQTIETGLRSVNAYPIHPEVLENVCIRRGLTLSDQLTAQVMQGEGYNLAIADLLLWIADAPDISQGGQDFSMTDEQRTSLRNRANSILTKFNDGASTIYGYKGHTL